MLEFVKSKSFGLPLLLRLLYLGVFRTRGTAARYTLKRFFVILFVVPFGLLLQAIHRLALALDDLFYPGYRNVEIKDPLFIVGIHRSGTTYFHHLLAQNTDNFTAFRFWELLLAPSIIERKCWSAARTIDRALGGFVRRLLVKAEDRALAELRKIHHSSLFEPEEDEVVLIPFFASVLLLLPFPFLEPLWRFMRFDADLPIDEQDEIMARYKACVQRHLYMHGPRKRFLSKNPFFTAKIEAINRAFPDAQIVCNVRNPYDAIPSMLSLVSFFWRNFDNDPQGHTLRDMLLEMADFFYRHPMEYLPSLPPSKHAFLLYDDLTSDPRQAVLDLYERFGIPLTPAFNARLLTQGHRMRTFKSRHKYSLEQWELTEEQVRDRFAYVFQYFNLGNVEETEEIAED